MKDSIDQYLRENRAEGSLDSEGSFRLGLESARRKLSEFGQHETEVWTLLFAQAFCRLECYELTVETSSSHWFLRVKNPRPIPPEFGPSLARSELRFDNAQTPEQFMVLGLCGISAWPLIQVSWVEEKTSYPLLSNSEPEASLPSGVGLHLQFERGRAPKFPRSLWSRRLCFSPSHVYYRGEALNCDGASDYLLETFSRGDTIWLEYLLHRSSQQSLHPNPAGKAALLRKAEGEEDAILNFRCTTGVRWWDSKESGLPKENVVVFARNGLFGATRFHPVKAGCLLEPFEKSGFPQGFEVVFSADRCPTDLSQMKLLDSRALQERLSSLVPVLARVLKVLYTSIESTENIVKPKRTPITADLAPGFMGLMAAATLVASGLTPPGLVVGGLLGGPPALYFWYSRKQRRREFQVARTITLAALDNRQAMLREFRKGLEPD